MTNNRSDTNTPPDILYHYTTQSSLLGIINEKSIRATDIFYLNDATEYIYAFALINDVINEHIKVLPPGSPRPAVGLLPRNKTDITEITYDFMISLQYKLTFLTNAKGNDFADIFVCSFSEKDDQLSQWRGYCPNGNGFCIGFDTRKLESLMKNFKLVECIYEKELQTALIHSIIKDSLNELKSEFKNKGKDISDEAISKINIYTAYKLFETAPSFKDISFKDEEEWRFVATINTGSSLINYREGKSMIIPYVSVPLTDKNLSIPIERLIVGPTPHKELASSSAKMMLLSKGLKDCKIKSSKIPYRAW